MSGLPWVRFFPSDWLAGTRGMSAAETGVYISLIAMMYERSEPLAENPAHLSRLCGASNASFKVILATLIEQGKIVRVEGGLWNARVEKEQVYLSEKSEVGKQAAEKRWRKDKEKQQASDANAMPSQCDGNANQKPDIRIEDSEANASAADAAPDYVELLWSEGRRSLVRQTGKTDKAARALIGQWRREAKEDCRIVYEKIVQAETDRVSDPVAWIAKAVQPRDDWERFVAREQAKSF